MDVLNTYTHNLPSWGTKVLTVVLCGFIHIYIRRLKKPNIKKWMSSMLGMWIVWFVMGYSMLTQFLIVISVNIVIMSRCKKRYSFFVSIHFTLLCFGYWILLDYTYPDKEGIFSGYGIFLNFVMLKLVNITRVLQELWEVKQTTGPAVEKRLNVYYNLTVLDILHYSFSHVSLFCGYLRYYTYHDWIHHPLSEYAGQYQLQELKRIVAYVGFCALLIFVFINYPHIQLVDIDRFVSVHPLWQMLIIQRVSIPWLLILYGVWTIGDLVLITSGLGVYPVSTSPRSGQGPTTNLELLEEIHNDPALAREQEYSSDTIRHVLLYKAITVPTMREFWRYYNSHTHSFLKHNVYYKFPVKRLRLLSAFAVSAYFHGLNLVLYIVWLNFVIHIEAEDVWKEVLKEKQSRGVKKSVVNLIFWIARMFTMGQSIGVLVALFYSDVTLMYFNATYYIPVLFPIIMFISGSCMRCLINM